MAARTFAIAIHVTLSLLLLAGCAVAQDRPEEPVQERVEDGDLIPLPAARSQGPVSVEQALVNRRSIRRYGPDALSLDDLSQVLWAAQGVTKPIPETPPGFRFEWRGGLRTAPSAGALYPLEILAVVGRAEGLEPGVYRYRPVEHSLELEAAGDARAALSAAAHGQNLLAAAPVVVAVTGVTARTAAKYGERAEQYVLIEVGAAAENLLLQCEALGLASVFVGGFVDEEVDAVLQLPEGEKAYALLPVGRRDAEADEDEER